MTSYDDDERERLANSRSEAAAAILALEQRQNTSTEKVDVDATDPLLVTSPDDVKRVLVNLEQFAGEPRRHSGTVRVNNADSFIGLVRELTDQSETTSRVYADAGTRTLVAVLNDDGLSPGWRDHRIELALRPTPAWTFWRSHDRAMTSQVTFSEWIEEGNKEIVNPSPAEMLDIAQHFQATMTSKFASVNMLDNGRRQILWDEDVTAGAGAGNVTVPSTFDLRMVPFVDGGEVDILARLRYRPQSGQLQLGYFLERPDEVEDEAFQGIVAAVAQAELGIIFQGSAPASRAAAALVSSVQ